MTKKTLEKFLKASIAFSICLSFLFIPFGEAANAGKTLMTGDYMQDTISVAQTLKETIALERDDEKRLDAEKEAISLITDYISRYRNRSQVNGTNSFTTMQTALNALAGHYKTFAKRPVPEDLKERLTKELNKAEKLVTREA